MYVIDCIWKIFYEVDIIFLGSENNFQSSYILVKIIIIIIIKEDVINMLSDLYGITAILQYQILLTARIKSEHLQ